MIASIKSQLFGAPEDLWEPETKVHKWFKSWLIGPRRLSLYVSSSIAFDNETTIAFVIRIGDNIYLKSFYF